MFKKTALSVVFATMLTLSLFNSQAAAASTVSFCIEVSCSSMTVTFGGVTHPETLNCDNFLSFEGVSAGEYSYSISGCGLTASGSVTVNGTSSYTRTICPPSGWPCCPIGCGADGDYKCSCSGTTTTTTTSTTTTSTSNTTTTTLPTVLTAPTLTVTTSGTTVSLSWTSVAGAAGYTLYYAPYPKADPIGNIPMGTQTSMSASLPDGTAFYVAIQAYNGVGYSGYSNIEYFILTADSSGLPLRPPMHINHPSGATADVPGGPALYSHEVNLNQIALPNDSRLWDWNDVGWQFVSLGGLTIEKEVTLTLPAAGVSGETVLVNSSTGDWIELKSRAVTLSSGAAGREVRIGNVPTPWILVVAKPTGEAPLVDVPESTQLEQLYWTDREEWKRRTLEWLSTAAPDNSNRTESASSLRAVYYCTETGRELDKALLWFNAVQLGGAATETVGLPPFTLYLKGLDSLNKVRRNWNEYCSIEKKEKDPYSEDLTVDQAIENALANYAPWGIDFMRFLLHTGTIGSFDLEVLSPYGEKKFVDVPLSNCKEIDPFKSDIQEMAATGTDANLNCYFRLYSSSALTETWVDWLKDWKIQKAVNWAPTALMAAGLVNGATEAAAFFALASELVSFIQSNVSEDTPTAYLGCEAFSMAVPTGNFVVDYTAHELLARWPGDAASLSAGAARLGFAQSLYSLALLYGVSQTDWYMLKEIRSLTTGTRSYCPKGNCSWGWWNNTSYQIPPVQVLAVLLDHPNDQPSGGYPIIRSQIGVWTLDYVGNLSPKDLHSFFELKRSCENLAYGLSSPAVLCPSKDEWHGGLADIPFESYKKDNWPLVKVGTTPAAQSIRLSISKSVLAQIATDWNLPPSPKPEEYALVVRAEASEYGSRALFEILKFDEKRTGDDPQRVYFTVVIYGKWLGEDASLDDLKPEYDGPRSKMSDDVLETKLTIELRSANDDADKPRARGNINFIGQDKKLVGKLLVLNPDEKEKSERVQHVSVALEPPESLAVEIGDTEILINTCDNDPAGGCACDNVTLTATPVHGSSPPVISFTTTASGYGGCLEHEVPFVWGFAKNHVRIDTLNGQTVSRSFSPGTYEWGVYTCYVEDYDPISDDQSDGYGCVIGGTLTVSESQ